MMAGVPMNLDEQQEVEERERQRLRDELKLSKLGSTDSHGLQTLFPNSFTRFIIIIIPIMNCMNTE